MLSELFYWLFNMSIVATLTGAVVMLLRLIKRIPRRVIAMLWAIPFIRMWIPIGIGGKYGLMAVISRFTTKTITVYESGLLRDFTLTNSIMAADSYFPITYKVQIVGKVFHVSSVIWAVAAFAVFLTFTAVYFATLREIKSSSLLYENVYVSDKVTSPSVYGVFRPRIVIPPETAESGDLRYILLHEKQHIRRLDNLWRVLAFATAALHCANPFVWIFLKCFLSALEVACVESVLQKCGDDVKKVYALALVSCAEHKTLFVSAFGGARVRTRIERILSFKKMTAASAVLSAVLIAAIAYFLLTNAY